jgi:hypothetical protein
MLMVDLECRSPLYLEVHPRCESFRTAPAVDWESGEPDPQSGPA